MGTTVLDALAKLLPIRGLTVNLRFLRDTRTAFFPHRQIRSFLTTLVGGDFLKNDPWLWIEAPESGQTQFQCGDDYRLHILTGGDDRSSLEKLMQALQGLPQSYPLPVRPAAVLADNLQLKRFEDYFSLSGTPVYQAEQLNAYCLESLEREVAFYAGTGSLTLRFTSPARLKISAERAQRHGNVRPYIQDSGQVQPAELERRIARALANLAPVIAPTDGQIGWRATEAALFWAENVRTSEGTGKPPFGGVLGAVRLQAEELSEERLPLLILGQYYGMGEMRGYGYGRYRLERMDGRGTRPPRAFSRSILARASSIDTLERAWRAQTRKHPYYGELLYHHNYREEGADGTSDRLERISLLEISHRLARGDWAVEPLIGRILHQTGRNPRPLAVPPLPSRIAQRALMETLLPALDRLMYDASHGFRRGHSRLTVRGRVQHLVRRGNRWCFETDIDSFFDRVPFEVVENRLRSLFPDDPAVDIIMAWVTAPVVFQGHRIERDAGLPQGSPLSPLLANLLLTDLDADIQAMRLNMLRFADDLVVLCKTREQAELAAVRVERSLAELGLETKPAKTRLIEVGQGFNFLGYTFINELAVDNHRPRRTPPQPLKAETIPPFSWLAKLVRKQPRLLAELAGSQPTGGEPVPKTGTAPASTETGAQGNEFGRTLFVTGLHKSLKRLNRRIVVFDDGEVVGRYPLANLHAIVLIGNHKITTPALTAAMEYLVPVHFLSASGRYQGVAAAEAPTAEGNRLWLDQAVLCEDEARCLGLSRQLVHARMSNQMEVLRQRARNGPASLPESIQSIGRIRRQLRAARAREALMGFEGAAGQLYYRALSELLPEPFRFEQRSKHPAKDPFCSLLDLGFSTLRAMTGSVVRVAGLHPWSGIYHQGRDRHQALASDMMEPFRHIVERTALSLIKRSQLHRRHFYHNDLGHCRLNDEGFRIYYPALIDNLNRPVRGRGSEHLRSMPEQAYAQALSLVRHIRDNETPFWVFAL